MPPDTTDDTADLTTDALGLINQASAQAEGSGAVLSLNDVDELLTAQQAAKRYDKNCPPPQRGTAKKAAMKSRKRKKVGVRAIELLNESQATMTKAANKIRKLMRTS